MQDNNNLKKIKYNIKNYPVKLTRNVNIGIKSIWKVK